LNYANCALITQQSRHERGTHGQLMAASGFYHDLYMSQFRYDAELPFDVDKEPVEVGEMQPVGVFGES
jgi:hypothetical protein